MKLGNRSIYFLLIFSIISVLASAVITHYNTVEKRRSTELVMRRYQAIAASEYLLSLMKDMETGQRGYVVTKDSEFLEPYNKAKDLVDEQIDSLKKLFSGDPKQLEFLENSIVETLNNKRKELDYSINLVNAFGKDSAANRESEKVGKVYMDSLQILTDRLSHRERTLLSKHLTTLERNTRIEDSVRFFAFLLIGVTSLVALLALVSKQKNIIRLIGNLEASNQSLLRANETLELKVAERTQELVKLNQTKDQFLGIASHDLKVPLVGVVSLIRLMKSDGTSRSTLDLEYLNVMEESCTNMQALISNLLDLNQIERGRLEIHKAQIQLAELLKVLTSEFTEQIKNKEIDLIIQAEAKTIKTDRNILYQILQNLVSNAIKFSSNKSLVKISTQYRNEFIEFEISDTGMGIPAAEVPLIFTGFNRLSNKPTQGESSTGLGLSIVKALVHALDGEITVVSEVGKGSVFTVILLTK
jgi:signal transduction histidine kinase